MNLKNLSAQNKVHNKILTHLNKIKISKIFKEFCKSLNTSEDLAVAVSGGPDRRERARL